jgi:hypothetical protein
MEEEQTELPKITYECCLPLGDLKRGFRHPVSLFLLHPNVIARTDPNQKMTAQREKVQPGRIASDWAV